MSRDHSNRITGIAIEQQHPFTVEKKTETDKSLYSETLEYTSDNKVARHTLFPGGDMDALVHNYSYSNATTTLVAFYKSAVPRTSFVRNYRLANGLSFVEHYGSQAVPTCKQRSHTLDTGKKTVVSETRTWEGEALVDQQSLTVDAVGNPVRRANGDEITYWTYYNNYQQFSVTETRTAVEDWSFFGCLFKGLDYVNVIGLGFAVGGSGGMTWGTRIDSTVDMSPALNDYAKKAFNLPVSISHCGSDRPFSGETESELVCRTVAGKEEPQRLTFFGYAMVDGRIRAKNRLTILQPDCIKVDVVEQQLKVAKDAAAPFITSLNAQIRAASDKERPVYQKTLDDLNKSLQAQSKANGEGYKLQTWKAASMVLETYEYHTVKGQPGYGTLKSCETVQVQQSGALLESSRVKTSYEYSEDAKEPHRLTIKTTVSRVGETAVTSSQTRSRLTGRLLESTDTEGNKVVRSYDPQGNLKSETVTKNGKEQRKTTCTLARQLVWQFDMVEDSNTTRIERDSLGRKIAEAVKPDGSASFLETWRWTYDALGRLVSSVETDYGAGNARIAMRKSSRSYDALSGRITTSSVLQDGNGKDIRKISQEQTPSLRGERFVQGKFSVDRQYDVNKGTFTEQYSLAGSEGCRIERSLSAEGLMKSVRYLTVDTAKKATEQDRLDFEHDKYAQLTKVTPRLGGAIGYRHDSAGRLLTTTREGVVLANSYDANGLSSVASESKVTQDGVEQSLGTQRVDLLGRAIDRLIDGNKTEFSYSGASTRATLKTAASTPERPSDYSSSTAAQARTHTQKFAGKSSTLVFSTGGRVVGFTDLTGAKTTYEYDFFNRLTGSTNEHCVCTWAYLDNGLLGKETVKAVKAGNLLMTVDYVYDGLGQEIKRTFTCSCMQTLSLERTLLGDGRLGKSVIRAVDKQVYSDEYTYDKSLRLINWRSEYGRNDGQGQSRTGSWSYDALGNLTDSLSALGQLTTSRQYDKDKPGQLSKHQVCHTNQGSQSALQKRLYTHDSAGRTRGMIDGRATEKWNYHDNGQAKSLVKGRLDSPDTSEYTFSYDDEGRVRGGSTGTQVDAYHYCGDRVYALVQTDSAKGAGFTSRTLVLRNESRACLMQDADTDGTCGRSFELRDANGTVFASVDLATKAITWFRYYPYGERYSGEKPENWLGFKGEPINRLGLYHLGNGYRLYDPALGCFLARDSKSPFGVGGAAAYVFCNGDPVNHADPSGHEVVAQYSRWGTVPAIQSTAFRIVLGAVSVLLAPFTAGASMLLAVATTALAAIAFAFDVASIIISQSDPQLAATLEAWGQVFGIASAAAGISISVQGIKGLPRNIFRSRGGPVVSRQVKLVKTPSELLIAQQARTKALNQLIQHADEAKAAGTYDAFKASHLSGEGGAVGGGLMPGITLDTRFNQRGINGSKNLYKSIVNQFDDSSIDFLGKTLDMVAGPNTLIQKFIPPMVSETEIVSLVALPMPGRENPFP